MKKSIRPIATLIAVTIISMLTPTARGVDILTNGDFAEWSEGLPVGWQVAVGAKNSGGRKISTVEQIAGGGMRLRGDVATTAWYSVSQELKIELGKSYKLTVEAVSAGVKRDRGQFDNCYAGVLMFDAAGKRVGMAIEDLSDANGRSPQTVHFNPPVSAAKATLTIFLSKTGSLVVKNVDVDLVVASDPFDELLEALRTSYSFTEVKGVEWTLLSEPHAEAANAAASREEFADIVAAMLAELEDLHVWIELPDGRRIYPHRTEYRANFDRGFVRRDLTPVEGIGHIGRFGKDIAVLAIDALPVEGPYEAVFDFIDAASKDCQGIVVDLRSNGGGAESRAAEIAGRFLSTPAVYARGLARDPASRELRALPDRILKPTTGRSVELPLVCLIGPGCVSSGEGMALMMKHAVGATMVGQNTRGASGNPRPTTLSNGVRVWFSRWVSLEPDGTPIEGRGVEPDQRIEHTPGTDATFLHAVEVLKRGRG